MQLISVSSLLALGLMAVSPVSGSACRIPNPKSVSSASSASSILSLPPSSALSISASPSSSSVSSASSISSASSVSSISSASSMSSVSSAPPGPTVILPTLPTDCGVNYIQNHDFNSGVSQWSMSSTTYSPNCLSNGVTADCILVDLGVSGGGASLGQTVQDIIVGNRYTLSANYRLFLGSATATCTLTGTTSTGTTFTYPSLVWDTTGPASQQTSSVTFTAEETTQLYVACSLSSSSTLILDVFDVSLLNAAC